MKDLVSKSFGRLIRNDYKETSYAVVCFGCKSVGHYRNKCTFELERLGSFFYFAAYYRLETFSAPYISLVAIGNDAPPVTREIHGSSGGSNFVGLQALWWELLT